jgi:hypothetical protein
LAISRAYGLAGGLGGMPGKWRQWSLGAYWLLIFQPSQILSACFQGVFSQLSDLISGYGSSSGGFPGSRKLSLFQLNKISVAFFRCPPLASFCLFYCLFLEGTRVPRGHISKRSVEALTCPAGKPIILGDDALVGFGSVAQPSGVRSYCVQFRAGGGSRLRLLRLRRFESQQKRIIHSIQFS